MNYSPDLEISALEELALEIDKYSLQEVNEFADFLLEAYWSAQNELPIDCSDKINRILKLKDKAAILRNKNQL